MTHDQIPADPQDGLLTKADIGRCRRVLALLAENVRDSMTNFDRPNAAVAAKLRKDTAEREKILAAHFLTESQTADLVGRSVSTLRTWRRKGRGPGFVDLGPLVYYPLESLKAWREEQER